MKNKIAIPGLLAQMSAQGEEEPTPFLEWIYEHNLKTGKDEFKTLALSDGTKLSSKKDFRSIFKKATGAADVLVGEKILKKTAHGFSSENYATRLNDASALLPALQPQDETEALLAGQFLALQDSAMKCLRAANSEGRWTSSEKMFAMATKLCNTANQTMQTLMKYRSKGQQLVQVVHIHNEGQAIVAQNISPQSRGG